MPARMDDNQDLAEMAMLARRAGLTAEAAAATDLLAADRRNRPLLEALRASLDLADEPALTFDADHD
jgi:hypothetical protein